MKRILTLTSLFLTALPALHAAEPFLVENGQARGDHHQRQTSALDTTRRAGVAGSDCEDQWRAFAHRDATDGQLCGSCSSACGIGSADEYVALQGIARVLTKRGQFDEALKTLERAYLPNLQGVWKENILRSIEAVNKARKPQ